MGLINGCQVLGIRGQGKAKILLCLLLTALFALLAQGQAQGALEGPGSGLVGWWKFDEGSGTTAADSSGNGNNGALLNGLEWTTGMNGSGALSFDGVNDYVMTGPIQSAAFTGSISLWAYRGSDAKQNYLFDARGGDGSGTGYAYMLGNKNVIFVSSGNVYVNGVTDSPRMNTGAWYHIVISGISLNIKKDLKIGAERSGYILGALSWNGYIDDVRVYNRALSDYEVTELYYLGRGLTPPPPFDATPLPSAKYKLASGPWSVESLPSPVQAATLVGSKIFRHPITRQVHYIYLYYNFRTTTTTLFQILDLNMDTGEHRLVDGGLGRPYIDKSIIHPDNGKVYIPTEDPGLLVMYDPMTGAAKTIKKVADGMAWVLVIGDDRKIYLGGAAKGYLESYDPSLDPEDNGVEESWVNYGIVDDTGAPYYRYIYRAGCDGRYMYMGIRDEHRAPAIWYLVIKDLVTREERKFFENDPTIVNIYPYSSRRRYGVVPVGYYDPVKYIRPFYRFDGFVQGPQVDDKNLPGDLVVDIPEIEINPAGYAADESGNTPDCSNNGTGIIKWKKQGDTDWRNLEVTGIRIGDVALRGVYSYPEAPALLGLPEAYDPSFSFDHY